MADDFQAHIEILWMVGGMDDMSRDGSFRANLDKKTVDKFVAAARKEGYEDVAEWILDTCLDYIEDGE